MWRHEYAGYGYVSDVYEDGKETLNSVKCLWFLIIWWNTMFSRCTLFREGSYIVSYLGTCLLLSYLCIFSCGAPARFRVMTSSYWASLSHSDTSQSVGLLWTSEQPEAETTTWQQTTITRDKTSMPAAGFETTIPASEPPHTHALDRATSGIGHCTI